ncbi:MAG TPA: serine--tRNA ligase [Caulobacteraceae bacterium]
MHDIRAIRDDPERYVRGWSARGVADPADLVGKLLTLDAALRATQTGLQDAQARRNELSKQVGQAKGRKDDTEAERLMAEVDSLKGEIAERFEAEGRTGAELRRTLEALPNIAADDVPIGPDEEANVELRRWGQPFAIANPKDHVDLGEALGLMDFEAAARMSGARFVVLKSQLARLERAIGQFMLDLQTAEHGYMEISPPLLVRDEAVFGAGQLPKFAEDLFHTTDDRWLISTAEVPLTNLVREQITPEEELPLRFTALTPCFRSEAGASGKDTRGMIRQHQFHKVELVSITTPEQSPDEHERMVGCAEAVLKRLELPFRTMLLCSGDMGFSARRTYDLEVWLPSQGRYREISSCSNCGDFQARRMDARSKSAGGKGSRYVHTLNGSGLAVGRTLVAIMENYQDEGGRIAIPQALHSYMRGQSHIESVQ